MDKGDITKEQKKMSMKCKVIIPTLLIISHLNSVTNSSGYNYHTYRVKLFIMSANHYHLTPQDSLKTLSHLFQAWSHARQLQKVLD
jgi:hypothetical protein